MDGQAEELKTQVEESLGPLFLGNVRVRVEGQTVWLEGTVTSSTRVEEAERRARLVPGIGQIVNDLVVEPLEVPLEDGAQIEEEYEYGQPPLGATQDVMEAGAEAESFGPAVDPVTRPSDHVEQGLEVTGGFAFSAMDDTVEPDEVPPEPFTDGELERRVLQALRRDAGTSDLSIAVQVVNGVAYLRGQVRFLQDAELAEEVAARVPGIIEVSEQLDVEGA